MTTVLPEDHPTKFQLIEAVNELFDKKGSFEVTLEDVQSATGISTGSIYHHFDDFGNLVITALSRRAFVTVEQDVATISAFVENSDSREEFLAAVGQLTEAIYSPTRALIRMEKLELIAMARTRQDFYELIQENERDVTAALGAVIARGQEKNLLRRDMDPVAFAVWLQSYSFGSILNDLNPDGVSASMMIELIMQIFEGLSPLTAT